MAKKVGFTLPDKKVTLKPIKRRTKFMGSTDHDGSFMYTNCSVTWSIFRNSHGVYIDPLTEKERIYFEEKFPGQSFNVNSKENFWKTFTVKITKSTSDLKSLERVFDLSKEIDYLSYKLLLTAPDVANDYKHRNDTPEYRWVLISRDEEIETKLTEGKMKSFCYNWVSENENKTNTLRDMLWLLGVKISTNNSRNELLENLYSIIEKPKEMRRLYTELNSENLNSKLLFNKFIKAGYIKVFKTKYYQKTGELVGTSKNQALKWILDPENSQLVEQWKDDIKKMTF